MKTTKIIFTSATVVLLSLFATSCIPTVPGGNPTPTPSTDSNVYYKFANTSLLNSGQGSIYENTLDLNLDSITDIKFYLEATYGREGIYIIGEPNTFILSPTNTSQAFTKDSSINSASFVIPQFLICDCNSQGSYPYSNTRIWYIGFKTTINGNTHYGWMQLKYYVNIQPAIGFFPIPNVVCTLIDYAYHKIPNTPIQTGTH